MWPGGDCLATSQHGSQSGHVAKRQSSLLLYFYPLTSSELPSLAEIARGSAMLSLKKDKKEEEDKDGGSQYSNLEKTSVLQEAR